MDSKEWVKVSEIFGAVYLDTPPEDREAELAQSVTHPGVCRVYDLSYEGEIPFLSMELLYGESLAQRLRHGQPVGGEEAGWILRQCASALDAAHRAGLIHLDFKPANV